MKTIKLLIITLAVVAASMSFANAQTRFHVSVNTPGVHVSAGNYHHYHRGYYAPVYYHRTYYRPVYYGRHYYRRPVYHHYYRRTLYVGSAYHHRR